MPSTVSSTLLGTFKSIARAATWTAQGQASVDVLTIAHQLNVCPDIMLAVSRCAGANVSGGSPTIALRSWNASQAIFDCVGPTGPVTTGQVDIICELTWAPAR